MSSEAASGGGPLRENPSTKPTQDDAQNRNSNQNQNQDDVDIDAEMADVTQDTTATGDSGANAAASSTVDNDPHPDISNTATAADPSSQMPAPQSRKDVTLREFLSKMDDYAPIIPDAVTAHYLTLAGLPPPSASDPAGERGLSTPLPLARLLALATQKFVADIAADAYQYSRIRASNTGGGGGGGLGMGMGVGVGATAPGQAGAQAGGAAAGGKGNQGAQLGVQRAGFGGGGQGGSAQGKTVLTMEDLGMAVQEYGINVRRGEFYR